MRLEDSAYGGSESSSAAIVCPQYDAVTCCSQQNSATSVNEPLNIVIDNGRFTINITRDLLFGLLTVAESCQSEWLFVPAISIDQGNHEEKAHQSKHIDIVYSGASRVLVWLGIADGSPESSDMVVPLKNPFSRRLLTLGLSGAPCSAERCSTIVPGPTSESPTGTDHEQVHELVDFSWILDEKVLRSSADRVLATLWQCIKRIPKLAAVDNDTVLAKMVTNNAYDNLEELSDGYMSFCQYLESWTYDHSSRNVRAESAALRFAEHFMRAVKGKAFFTTSQLMGLCSSNARRGDYVCFLAGQQSMAVLRRHDNGHSIVIGEAQTV